MPKLREFFTRGRRLWRGQRGVHALEAEVAKLRSQNERMKAGMRRCLTCEYRIESEERRAGFTAGGDYTSRADK